MIKKHTITLVLLLGAIATATAQWTTLQLPTPRTLMEGVYAKGKVYFAGGYQQIAPTFVASSVVDIYDISTGTWSSTNLSQPRINIGGTVLGDSILFVGGTTFDASGNAELSTVMDIYNQTTSTWTRHLACSYEGNECCYDRDKSLFPKRVFRGFRTRYPCL